MDLHVHIPTWALWVGAVVAVCAAPVVGFLAFAWALAKGGM